MCKMIEFFQLDVDGHWLSALHWYLANICTDEDLYCQETTPLTRECGERYERFIKILRVLLFKSEVGHNFLIFLIFKLKLLV